MLTLLVVTEVLKWFAIVAGLYLCVWQYTSILGTYAVFISSSTNPAGQFWGIFTVIIVGISLVLYLPCRIFSVQLRSRHRYFRDERWKPSILVYILLCAVPGYVLVLDAFETKKTGLDMQPITITCLQIVVLGLVLTEWMTKIQQEVFTFNLLTAMALDFFFAYDVIAFIMMASATNVAQTAWIYPCFVFAVIAMCKYLPTQPVEFIDRKLSTGHIVCIVTSMFCNDIPFIVIRLATMIIFESFLISDMVFLVKNFFVIIFNLIQLGVIFYNRKYALDSPDGIPEQRMFRDERDMWGGLNFSLGSEKRVSDLPDNCDVSVNGTTRKKNRNMKELNQGQTNETLVVENIEY